MFAGAVMRVCTGGSQPSARSGVALVNARWGVRQICAATEHREAASLRRYGIAVTVCGLSGAGAAIQLRCVGRFHRELQGKAEYEGREGNPQVADHALGGSQ